MSKQIVNWLFESLLDNTSPLWTGVCIVCGIGVSVFIVEYLKHEILKIKYERQRISIRKKFRHQNSVARRARTEKLNFKKGG